MTDDSRTIWCFTEGHLRQWMRSMLAEYQDGTQYDFPDPESLTSEQVEELYHRLNRLVENGDGPRDDMRGFARFVLQDMGLIRDPRGSG